MVEKVDMAYHKAYKTSMRGTTHHKNMFITKMHVYTNA